jgi:hypothetical protein
VPIEDCRLKTRATPSRRDGLLFNRQSSIVNRQSDTIYLGRNGRAVTWPSNRLAQRPGIAVPHFGQAPSAVRR